MPTLRQQYVNIYWAWKSMKQRTLNPKCKAYPNYGGRGVGICEQWLEFEPFLEWSLNNGWKKGLELDRADNNGDYTPSNCRWVERRTNVNNRRKTVVLEVNGEKKPLTEWAEIIGCDRAMITYWIKNHGKSYAAERIAEALDNGYKKRNFSYGHSKRVRHVESGVEFESAKVAAEHFGFAPPTISTAARSGRITRCGTFEYL